MGRWVTSEVMEELLAASPRRSSAAENADCTGGPKVRCTAEQRTTETKAEYAIYPRRVLKTFRELVLERYPALREGPNSRFYRELVQYCLYSQFFDKESRERVLPKKVVAALVGLHPDAHGFKSGDWIRRFNEDVFDLGIEEGSIGRASIITNDIDPALRHAHFEQCAQLRRQKGGADVVDFISGEVVGRRKREQRKKDYEAYLDQITKDSPPDHPAIRLIEHLNGSSQVVLRSYVRRNWNAMCDFVDRMPTNDTPSRRSREYVDSLMAEFEDRGVILRYKTSDATARLFAAGGSIISLPRELRKISLEGTVALDLKAAQLAIVAKLYGCEKLHRKLSDPSYNFWNEMLQYLGLDDGGKDLLKNAIYAIVFGMGWRNYRRLLTIGCVCREGRIIELPNDPGIGRKLTDRFLRHPLVRELVNRRNKAMRAVSAKGWEHDAWGRKIPLVKGNPPALLANIAQSYEVRIMLAMMPIIESERGVQIVSFVHDGCYLHFSDKWEQDRQLKLLRAAVKEEAESLGMPTRFDE